jgi:G3E family GTPase
MSAGEVIAIIGACDPERASLARRWAKRSGRLLVTARRLERYPSAIDAAATLASHSSIQTGLVIEFPSHVSVTDLIGTLADPDGPTRLMAVACVADAAHLVRDLQRDDYVSQASAEYPGEMDHTARALLTVTQLEFASTVILVNWASLDTPDLSTMMALVSHLNPHARLRLDHKEASLMPLLHAHSTAHAGAGWVKMLNGTFDPHMTDPRVSAVRYEQARPFHPERLQRVLDEQIERGECGTIVRSSGFCRLATRPGVTAHWDHVGTMISFSPLTRDHDNDREGDDEPLALGQDLIFIGLDVKNDALVAALDEAVLTDDELLAGPKAWQKFSDPFPAWHTVARGAEDPAES